MENLQLDKMQNDVENIWRNRNELIDCNVKITARALVEEIVNLLDCGKIRVAEKLRHTQRDRKKTRAK